MKQALETLGQMAIEGGLVRRADLTLELDNDRLANVMQGLVITSLNKLPYVELLGSKGPIATLQNDRFNTFLENVKNQGISSSEDPINLVTMSEHVATLRIDHARLAEGVAKSLQHMLHKLKDSSEHRDDTFSYKITPNDDGKKIHIETDMNVLNHIISEVKSGKPQYHIDGIIDRSDIPQNSEEMLHKLQTLIGMDAETKETIVDGQALLKLLQAGLSKNHEKTAGDSEKAEPTPEEMFDRFKSFLDKIPGSKVERDENNILIELDMKQLSDSSKHITDKALSQVKGITLSPENGEDSFVTTAKLNFKQLTLQAIEAAAESLRNKNGVRIRTGEDSTSITFNTDVMTADQQVKSIQHHVNSAIVTMGGAIAQQALGAKPNGLIGNIVKHFKKGPENPGPQK